MRNDDSNYVQQLERALEAAELEIKGLEDELRKQDETLRVMQEQIAPTHMGEPVLIGVTATQAFNIPAIIRAQKQHVESMAKQARKCAIEMPVQIFFDPVDGKPIPETLLKFGLAVNTNVHMSEVGHELANASGTFGLVYYIGSDNKIRCSLRSNGEYDVSAIAKSFGGGGHRNAAGFETDINTLMGWLK